MIPNVAPSSAISCQYERAEKRLFRCATQPACSAELQMMCSAATWNSGSGVVSTSSAVCPCASETAAEYR
jgi:hypothetical protein